MAWPRDEPDSLRAKRRKLEEQERLLAERMSRLTQELRDGPSPEKEKTVEPPVWRMEEETAVAADVGDELGAAAQPGAATAAGQDPVFSFHRGAGAGDNYLFLGLPDAFADERLEAIRIDLRSRREEV